jgi:hypothetical protein
MATYFNTHNCRLSVINSNGNDEVKRLLKIFYLFINHSIGFGTLDLEDFNLSQTIKNATEFSFVEFCPDL